MLSSYLLFATILLAPLYVIRLKTGPLPSTLLEILIGLTTLAYLVERFLKHDSFHTWKRRLFSPLTYPAIALLAVATLAVVISPSHYQALGLWRAYFLEPLAVYFILLSKLREEKFAPMLLISWFGSALWIASLAIYQDLFLRPKAESVFQSRLNRPEAVFNSANDVALFIGPIASLGLALIRLHKVLIIVTIVLFAGVWVSDSRGGELALGSVLILFVLAYFWLKLSPKLQSLTLRAFLTALAVLIAILAALFWNLGSYQPPPKQQSQRPFVDTEVVRACLWQGTRALLIDHPILGVGLNGFNLTYPRYATCDQEDFQYPHNIVLNTWTELGLAGLAVFAWIYWTAFRLITRSHGHWLIKTTFIGALVYSLVHGLVDVPYFKNDLSLEFWILIAAITAYKESKFRFKDSN